jgi:hypothetical protein
VPEKAGAISGLLRVDEENREQNAPKNPSRSIKLFPKQTVRAGSRSATKKLIYPYNYVNLGYLFDIPHGTNYGNLVM